MVKRRVQKKRGKGKRKGGKGGASRPMPSIPMLSESDQRAHIIETLPAVDILANTQYSHTFCLNQFARAVAVANEFKWYRPKRVTYTYEPQYNTFQEGLATTSPGVGAPPAKPYMYIVMNRTQDSLGSTLAQLQQCGAQPQSFVNKREFTYRPNWCSPGLSVIQTGGGAYTLGLKAEYDWLPCNPTYSPNKGTDSILTPILPTISAPPFGNMEGVSTTGIVFNGHFAYFDQQNAITGTIVCREIITVEWEFKGANASRNN